MARCLGITAGGDQCSASVRLGENWCYNHSPERAEERRRNASKAGRSRRPSKEVAELKAQLQDIADDVLEDRLEPKNAAVAIQALNVKARVLDLERRILETVELAERLDRLEEALG